MMRKKTVLWLLIKTICRISNLKELMALELQEDQDSLANGGLEAAPKRESPHPKLRSFWLKAKLMNL